MEKYDQPLEWSLFNDEQESFLSIRSSTADFQGENLYMVKKKLKKRGSQQSNDPIQLIPLAYMMFTLAVLLLAVLSQFQNQRAQTFPLFSELPFHGNYGFTIGVAIISFLGIIVDYFIFSINQRRQVKKGCYSSQVSYLNFSTGVLLCGILSHFFFFAFAILPADKKTQFSLPSSSQKIFLTLSLILNFTFKCYFVFFNSKLRNPIQGISVSYQIKTALFTVICFLFSAFVCVNAISFCLNLPIFQDDEQKISDESSAAEDFVAQMVGEIYSTLSYSLMVVNSLFVGMYHYDLKLVHMTFQDKQFIKQSPIY